MSSHHRIVTELDALQAEVDAKRLQAETAAEPDALLQAALLERVFKGEL